MTALLGIIGAVALVIGLTGAIKSILRKEKRVTKPTGVAIAVGIASIVLAGVIATPAEKEAESEVEVEGVSEVEEVAEEATPEDRIRTVVGEAIDGKRILDVIYNDGHTTLKMALADNLTTNMIRKGAYMDVERVLKAFKDAKYDGDTSILVMHEQADKYGKIDKYKVMTVKVSSETLDKIDFDNFDYNNIPDVADEYTSHPSLQ